MARSPRAPKEEDDRLELVWAALTNPRRTIGSIQLVGREMRRCRTGSGTGLTKSARLRRAPSRVFTTNSSNASRRSHTSQGCPASGSRRTTSRTGDPMERVISNGAGDFEAEAAAGPIRHPRTGHGLLQEGTHSDCAGTAEGNSEPAVAGRQDCHPDRRRAGWRGRRGPWRPRPMSGAGGPGERAGGPPYCVAPPDPRNAATAFSHIGRRASRIPS